jgi:hypothetical protein
LKRVCRAVVIGLEVSHLIRLRMLANEPNAFHSPSSAYFALSLDTVVPRDGYFK